MITNPVKIYGYSQPIRSSVSFNGDSCSNDSIAEDQNSGTSFKKFASSAFDGLTDEYPLISPLKALKILFSKEDNNEINNKHKLEYYA